MGEEIFMEKSKEERYYKLLEQMVNISCRIKGYTKEDFLVPLTEFCELFRIAKGVTEFYENRARALAHDGEILIDYDNGHGDVEVHKIVITPDSGIVLIGTLYMSKDDEPLTDEELEKVDIAYRMVLSFLTRKRLQKTVVRFGYHDEDGYPNVRAFFRFIDGKIVDEQLYGNTAICMNLKHFSLVNQEIGRDRGDIVIRNFFNMIKDTIGEDGIICRMGGDNFVMMFKNELLDKVLEMLSGSAVSYDRLGGNRINVSASAGVYVIPEDININNPNQIMDCIYPAVYMARQRGINVVFYDENMSQNREKVKKVRTNFVEGMKKREIHAYYQPKVDIETGKVVGAEALSRWIHEGKMVMPMEFIPVIESSMDICALDFRILDIVCGDIRRWLDEGREVPRISVNFSRKHLMDADLLEHTLGIIDKYNVPHDYIEVELTETTTDVEFKDLSRVVNGLMNEGIYTSVDDFGNGYSSLNLIRSIPWNVMKVDRSLLPKEEDPDGSITHRMYKHVTAMAQDIGLECITEGVETERQIEILRQNNCHIAQGFFYDKALPVEEFEKKLGDFRY